MNLKELAKQLNLSQTTVSRALNGYPEVSEATRLRVQKAATHYKYAPSKRAKALATGRALAIGHVIPVSGANDMVNPVFGDFIAGAGEVCSAHGYEMTMSMAAKEDDEEKIYRNLKARGSVDGVVLHGPVMEDNRVALLRELGLPFVSHGRASRIDLPYSWVDVNNRSAFQRATDLLTSLGHNRIALLNGPETMDFAYRRRQGYEHALTEHGVRPDPALMMADDMTETYGFDAATRMMAAEKPPTAFLVSSIITAIGVRRAIARAGKVMGKDISVVTHDDNLSYLPNAGEVPIFTATRSSVRLAGNKVADLLLQHINDPTMPPQQELLEVELIIGQSTGPAPVEA